MRMSAIWYPESTGWKGTVSLLIVSFLLCMGCAKVGSPTGGPKDTAPPVMVVSKPENRSVNFNANRIEITFNEFIQLRNLQDQFLVSPPIEKNPSVTVRNKTVIIDMDSKLLPATTYTFNFGNSIADINEGNAILNFDYVFSTGTYVDSLSVTGKAVSAVNRKPPAKDEDVFIMLYDKPGDSLPLLERPRYIGKVNDNGLFSVNNIHPDTFTIIVLKDTDGDLRYDPVTDAIGFLDTLVVVSPLTVRSVNFFTDTVKVNDTLQPLGTMLHSVNLNMEYFNEETGKVFLNQRDRPLREKLFFSFTRPLYDSIRISPLNFTPSGSWLMEEYSEDLDSLNGWITDTSVIKRDTLILGLAYTTTDSLEQFKTGADTVTLIYRPLRSSAATRRRTEQSGQSSPEAGLNLLVSIKNGGMMSSNASIYVTADKPISQIEPERFRLFLIQDTLRVEQAIEVQRDSYNLRQFSLSAAWDEDSKYALLLLPASVMDIYGTVNDSLEISFGIRPENYHGRLLLTLQGESFPLFIRLLDEKNQIIRSHYSTESGQILFDYLEPGKYMINAFYDRNGNRKWDTGHYLKRQQPEPVYSLERTLELRSNWDYELTWQVGR